MKRTYELMFIVRPDMPEEEQSKLISTLESSVSSSGGTVKSEVWGKRRLAYAVRRFHDGIFVLLTLEGDGAMVHELERRLRVTEPVIKFITVRVDEEQKRLDKDEGDPRLAEEGECGARCDGGACWAPEAASSEPEPAAAPTQ